MVTTDNYSIFGVNRATRPGLIDKIPPFDLNHHSNCKSSVTEGCFQGNWIETQHEPAPT